MIYFKMKVQPAPLPFERDYLGTGGYRYIGNLAPELGMWIPLWTEGGRNDINVDVPIVNVVFHLFFILIQKKITAE